MTNTVMACTAMASIVMAKCPLPHPHGTDFWSDVELPFLDIYGCLMCLETNSYGPYIVMAYIAMAYIVMSTIRK